MGKHVAYAEHLLSLGGLEQFGPCLCGETRQEPGFEKLSSIPARHCFRGPRCCWLQKGSSAPVNHSCEHTTLQGSRPGGPVLRPRDFISCCTSPHSPCSHSVKSQLWTQLHPEFRGSPSFHCVKITAVNTTPPWVPEVSYQVTECAVVLGIFHSRAVSSASLRQPFRLDSRNHCVPSGNTLIVWLCEPNWKRLFKLDLVTQICNPKFKPCLGDRCQPR